MGLSAVLEVVRETFQSLFPDDGPEVTVQLVPENIPEEIPELPNLQLLKIASESGETISNASIVNAFQTDLNQVVSSKSNISNKNQKRIDNIQEELDTIKEQVVENKANNILPTSQPKQHIDSIKISNESDFKLIKRILKKIDEDQIPKVLKAIDKIPKADFTDVLDAIKTTSKKDTEKVLRAINKIPKTDLKDLVREFPKTDLSSVLTAISKIPKTDLSDVLAAIKDIPKTDLTPVLDAIDSIPKADYTEVLQAIANIPKTDLSGVLTAIEGIPSADLSEVLTAIENIPAADLSGVLSEIQELPTNDELNSRIEQLTGTIMGYDYLENAAVAQSVPDLIGGIESKIDEITGILDARLPVLGDDFEADLSNLESTAKDILRNGMVTDDEFDYFQDQLDALLIENSPTTAWSDDTWLRVAMTNNLVVATHYYFYLTVSDGVNYWISVD